MRALVPPPMPRRRLPIGLVALIVNAAAVPQGYATDLSNAYPGSAPKKKLSKKDKRRLLRIGSGIEAIVAAANSQCDDYKKLIQGAAVAQTCASSFVWAHSQIQERAEALRMTPTLVNKCWDLILKQASRLLRVDDLKFARASITSIPAAHNFSWNRLLNRLVAANLGTTRKEEDSVSNEIAHRAKEAVATMTPIISLSTINLDGRTAPASYAVKIKLFKKAMKKGLKLPRSLRHAGKDDSFYNRALMDKQRALIGTLAVSRAMATSVCRLNALASRPASWYGPTRSNVSSREAALPPDIPPSMLRWYLATLGSFQSQWAAQYAKGGGGSFWAPRAPVNCALEDVLPISAFVASGEQPLATWKASEPKWYIWPALVAHAEIILKYWRDEEPYNFLSPKTKLDQSADMLRRLLDKVDLDTCTAYELAAVLDRMSGLEKIAPFYDFKTGGWIIKKAAGAIPSMDTTERPMLGDGWVTTKVQTKDIPKSHVPRWIIDEGREGG
eukprot:Blabericola_migrator_1__3477@NODE_2029_length_3388_cov_20_334237_g1289_i0_p1_GENE_NODE_2029_length_3388_cov_20_334237_g1289_i0NODE_2029_length_3388_cov_20_334237_g1289_i0_p1_ORF_typecomplete_len500_score61_85_NODE_2029_length_3388_cov_20_334237_g1289_i018613360